MATSVSTDTAAMGADTAPISLRRRLAVSVGWLQDARAGRTPLLGEAIVIAWLGWLYDILTNLAPARQAIALGNASALLNLERALGVHPELALDRWLAGRHALALVLSNYYDNAHFVVTFGLLGLLWWRRSDLYPRLRNALVLMNVIAFAVFWLYPVAPPRLLAGAGFSDVVAASHAFGSWHTGSLAADADQYAAMPSLHIAWAVWCLAVVWSLTRRRWGRALAALHIALTTFAVLATGNHFLLDVLAGGGVAAAALMANLAWRSRYRMSQTCHEVPRPVDSRLGRRGSPID